MNASLRTQRLLIIPLSLNQLQFCATDLSALEVELGLPISRDVFTDVVWGAIHKKGAYVTVTFAQHPGTECRDKVTVTLINAIIPL